MAYASYLALLTDALAGKLADAPPQYTYVDRRRVRAFGPKRLARLAVRLPR